MNISTINLYCLTFKDFKNFKKPSLFSEKFSLRQLDKDTICFSGIKKENKTREEKIVKLNRDICSEESCDFIKHQSEENLNKLLELLKRGGYTQDAIEILRSGDEAYKMAIELMNKGINLNLAKRFIGMPKRNFEKALLVARKERSLLAKDIGNLPDDSFAKVYKQGRNGFDFNLAYEINTENDDKKRKIFELLSNGVPSENIDFLLLYYRGDKYTELINLIKEGVPVLEASRLIDRPCNKEKFELFKKEGYSPCVSAFMANFDQINTLNEDKIRYLAQFVNVLNENSNEPKHISSALTNKFIKVDFANLDIKEISDFASNIDYKKLYKIAPYLKSYSSKQLLDFIYWHYLKQTKEFTRETLTFRDDLTEYLENNYVSSEKLNEILTAYPYTPREVGEIPSDWLVNVQDKKEAKKEIYKAIQKFQTSKNEDDFASNLSKVLKKKVQIEWLGCGVHGNGYKIEIEDAKDVCLKAFFREKNTFGNVFHGKNAEPQTGLFLNKHSNKFVKTYFGKVCDEKRRDGFMVTQYLSESIIPEQDENITNLDDKIRYADYRPSNVINGKIIDIGGVEIYL